MQLPDDSWAFSTISPDIAARIVLGNSLFPKGLYVFPEGSPVKVSVMPNMSANFNSLSFVSPASTSSLSSGSTFVTASGNTVYTLNGTNTYGDAVVLGSTNIVGSTGPFFSSFSANSMGNTPTSPLQLTYSINNATNVAVTSNMRAITVPSGEFNGALIIQNPQDGEIFTLVATNTVTSQTEQITLTVDNSNKIFSCIPPAFDAVPTGARTVIYGGATTFCVSEDGNRLYIGRSLASPALIYLGTNLIETNELVTMRLSNFDPDLVHECGAAPFTNFKFETNGVPTIMSCDTDKIYVCQPAGGKVTVFDAQTQTAIEEIVGVRPTNIVINDNFIAIKDAFKLKIMNKSYVLQAQFDLDGMPVEANDKELFITDTHLYVLDGSKIQIIDLATPTIIEKTIDLSADWNIISGTIVFAETLDKIFVVGSHIPDPPTTTTTSTEAVPEIDTNLWVYNLTADTLESTTKIASSNRSDTRYSMRLDLDESRIFVVADWLNKVMAISTDVDEDFAVQEQWSTTKPFGIGISPDGKYLYYSGQDENTYSMTTQASRHIVIMRLFETQLTVDMT